MSFITTYFLIIPYITIIAYFFAYKRDNFFLKIRSSVQLLLILILLGMAFTNILVWKAFFEEYTFLNFDIQNTETQFKTTALVTALAAIAAVFGWIFTSRVQIINTVRSHSVQVLMNSRNSTVYIDKVDKATVIRRKLILERKPKPDEKVQLTVGEFKDLGDAEKSAVTYLLNFLEFVAIGIRHNNLDEDLIRGSFKSILKSNYILFQKIIEHLRELDNPKIYNQLEMLHKRWDEENHSKCAECKEWYKVGVVEGGFNTAKIVFTYILLNFFTCFLWSIISWIMQVIEWLTIHKESDKFICIDCLKGKDFE
ncbi:DUF4760 domain-containing protein [Acinetobacter sp. YH12069]|uniref:DUF4760 domain-containing protein n=1 Tax=Acinetobacter sp. YH12069 TaxID=2601065 RepID=UPI0015D3D597|nr:DUF4760 domain-containing protein [Acinetobacter sp. YH12069]